MIPLIPIPQQKAIAHILGTLDDKIELNQKMNETLEDIAKAIFKSWFVDFDPVRAKAEGRSTGQAAVESVVIASGKGGTKKGGVVWHTQGAGKSIEMACLAGRLISEPRLENPTLVMVTDRQDLDGQLFGVFANAGELLGETPKQANSRSELREHLMNRPSGGIIFTTIQKFGLEADEDKFPVLTDRHNIVVIADEAHRTQYGFKAKIDGESGAIKYGLAKSLRDALPNATFLAFTGTPISQDDRDTQAVFGEYVSIYDIQQAVVQ